MPDINLGSIVRFDPIPDDEGNHLTGTRAYFAGQEFVYLGRHPEQQFADIGIARVWVPTMRPGGGQYEGAPWDVDIQALTVVSEQTHVPIEPKD